MRDHMRAQAMRIWHWSNERAPSFNWDIGTGGKEDTEEVGEKSSEHQSGEKAPVLPQVTRVSSSKSREDHQIELAPLPNTNTDQ